MALAVTHVILTIVLIDLFRDYILKKKFPTYIVLIGGIAGLLPDTDIVFSWFYNLINSTSVNFVNFHKGITHSVMWPIIFLMAGLFLRCRKSKKNTQIILLVIAFGLFFHLVLDCIFGGYSTLLSPFCACNFCPQWNIDSFAPALDAIILVLWLAHEQIRHEIKDYI